LNLFGMSFLGVELCAETSQRLRFL
jgi:hypothetical protein